jgi:hypothetical protein
MNNYAKEKDVMTNQFTRRSINIDNDNFVRCKILAADLALSVSGVIRLLIKEAYERRVIVLNQNDSRS